MYISSATSTFKYSRQIAIYEASEITAGGGQPNSLITKIRWYRASSTGGYTADNAEMDIFIKGVSFSTHATSPVNWANEVSGATLVYSSTTQNINTTAGWQEFVLDEPFLWNGTDNLEVFVDFYRPSNAVGATTWRYTTKTNANAITGTTTVPTTATRNSTRPNIQFDMIPAIPAEYESSTVTQITGNVVRGENNYPVIRLAVTTSGFLNPLTIKKINFNTNGTTNTADLSGAKIYYTGTSPTFSTNTLFGEVNNPAGDITFTGSRELIQGTNYFWLAYDINENAIPGRVVDGEIVSFELEKENVTTNYFPPGTTEGNRTIIARLSGTYTVGAGGSYSSLAEAFTAINSTGLEDNTILEIVSNLNEASVPALLQWAETGSGNYTLTIRPVEGAKTITGNQSPGLIMFEGADRVIIDGGEERNLTIVNNHTTSAVIRVNGIASTNKTGSGDIVLRRLNIAGGSNTSSTSYGIYALGQDNDNLIIENNSIVKASTGIIVRGSNSATAHDNIDIVNNTIGSESAADYVLSRGIDLQYTADAFVAKNRIFNIMPATTATVAGIELGSNVIRAKVTQNKIHNVKKTTSGGGAYGINISTSTGNSNNRISNNFISGVSAYGGSTSTSTNAFGIRIAGGIAHEVYYNTVHMSGNFGTTSGISSALLVTAGSDLTVKNNIFSNEITAPSTGPVSYAIYTTSSTALAALDYNNYSVANSNVGVVGYWAGSESATLPQWQALTVRDFNSITKSPSFVNAAAGNLHLATIDLILAQGTPIPSEAVDIDEDPRRNTYIGADEVIPTIVINQQPMPYTQCFGRTAVLSVGATIDYGAEMSFRWQKDGVPVFDNERFSGTGTPTLTIMNSQPGDAGEYTVRVTGNSGALPLMSDVIMLNITAPVEITQQPQSQVICPGAEAALSIITDGTVNGVQWQKEDPNSASGYRNIAGATTKQIFLNNATNATSGKYRALIFGTCGANVGAGVADTTISEVATVFVGAPTWVARQVENEVTALGGMAALSVEAEVSGSPTTGAGYQWYRNGVALTDNARINGSTSSVLTIHSITAGDTSATYYAEVTGQCGTATSNAAKIYVAGISIAVAPQAAEVCPGSNATMTVGATSSIAGSVMTYQWMKNGVALTNGGRITGANTATLTIAGATAADVSSNYTVKVTSQPGSATITSAPVGLTLKSSAAITAAPQAQSVCEGEALELTVGATGSGLSYEWRLNGTPISGATGSSYSVPSATAAMAGDYTVAVKGECDAAAVTTEAVAVTVKAKPSVTAQPVANVSMNQFGTLTLTVQASGAGTLSYQWYKDGAEIAGATEATYTKANTSPQDAGTYHAVITGECGTTQSDNAVVQITTSVADIPQAGYALYATAPSPVTETGSIRFTLGNSEMTTITISDIFGRTIATLHSGMMTEGTHSVQFSAQALNLSSGVYMYTVETPRFRVTRQMSVVK
jgi:hypothetical protein